MCPRLSHSPQLTEAARLLLLPLLAAAWLTLSAGCARERHQTVRLANRVPTREVAQTSPDRPRLRVALAGIVSPSEGIASYDDLLRYLEARLDLSATVISGRSYAETNRLLRIGEVDMAIVCTYAYVRGHDEFGLRLLAAPQVSGQVRYRSYIIVPADSRAASLSDLRGRRFAFTDPLSLTGRIYPMAMLSRQGLDPDTFFGSVVYTHNHDSSVRTVAEGLADGAAVDSLVYDTLVAGDASIGESTKIIEQSSLFCSPPVVVRPDLPADRVDQLQQVLLSMHKDAKGREALAKIGIERFALVADSDYDSVRALAEEVAERL